jgi:HEAT repeat protein
MGVSFTWGILNWTAVAAAAQTPGLPPAAMRQAAHGRAVGAIGGSGLRGLLSASGVMGDLQNRAASYRMAANLEGARTAALEGLWEDEDPALIPILLKLLKDEAEGVRAAAAGALGRFVYAGELEDLPAKKVTPITAALKATFIDSTESIDVRRRALESLGFLGFEEVGELLKQGYEHPADKMRLSAMFAMGRSADDRWGEIAKHELDAGDPEMRFEAARACGELEYAPAVRRLTELIDDVDDDVQRAAIWALGQIGGDKARQVLQAVLDSDAEHLYEEAEAALDELEFKGNNLDFAMLDFEDEDDDEAWVLDQDVDEEDDDK